MKRLLEIGLLLSFLFAACVPAAGSSMADPQKLATGVWQLLHIQYADGRLSEADFGHYTLEFDLEAGRLSVGADCNQGGASFQATTSGRLALGPLALTRVACGADSIAGEFVAELGTADTYAFQGGVLILRNPAGSSLAFFR